jgi:hypothetical protein
MFDYLLLCMHDLQSYHIDRKHVLTAAIIVSLVQARVKPSILLSLAESMIMEDLL